MKYKHDTLVKLTHANRVATGWILGWSNKTEFCFKPNTDSDNHNINCLSDNWFCKTDYWDVHKDYINAQKVIKGQ